MQASDGKTYWVYITASNPYGVLYVGMTSDLAGRSWEHRERVMDASQSVTGLAAVCISRRMTAVILLPDASAPWSAP